MSRKSCRECLGAGTVDYGVIPDKWKNTMMCEAMASQFEKFEECRTCKGTGERGRHER